MSQTFIEMSYKSKEEAKDSFTKLLITDDYIEEVSKGLLFSANISSLHDKTLEVCAYNLQRIHSEYFVQISKNNRHELTDDQVNELAKKATEIHKRFELACAAIICRIDELRMQ
jgi:hypothetical protein